MTKKSTIILSLALVALIAGSAILYNFLIKDRTPEKLTYIEEKGEIDSESEEEKAKEDGSASLAPDFAVYTVDGAPVRLSDMRGTPVVLNFWASWCPPCKSEMPDFDEACRDYDGEVAFMMVNLTDGAQETVSSAREYIESVGYEFPVYYDTDLDAAIQYGISSVPQTFFINADGELVAYTQGAIDRSILEQGIGMIK